MSIGLPKVSGKTSVTISHVFVAVAFVCLAVMLFLLPRVTANLIFPYYGAVTYRISLGFLYAAEIPAFAADISLFLLLRNVGSGRIFTDKSVRYLRVISWACIIESGVFFAFGATLLLYLGTFTGTSIAVLLIAFAAAFMGTVLRVVKNVIEEAVRLKNENDFTV